MPQSDKNLPAHWRVIVVGGHTRSIGKTQLVCDVIAAFPREKWIAGKITQYGHGVCARNGDNCDCAPTEHVSALDWEMQADTGTDSARFLAAGACRSFWLRTKQGYLAEGLPLFRAAVQEACARIALQTVYKVLLERLPPFRLDPGKPAHFHVGMMLAVTALPVRWD